jgi:hypothetical protein
VLATLQQLLTECPLIDTYLVPEAPQGARSDPIPPLATSSAIGQSGITVEGSSAVHTRSDARCLVRTVYLGSIRDRHIPRARGTAGPRIARHRPRATSSAIGQRTKDAMRWSLNETRGHVHKRCTSLAAICWAPQEVRLCRCLRLGRDRRLPFSARRRSRLRPSSRPPHAELCTLERASSRACRAAANHGHRF